MTDVTFDFSTDLDEWIEQGRKLDAAHGSWAWRVGDWYLWGEDRFGSDAGIALYEIMGLAGVPRDEVTAYVSVARRFPPQERRTVLSWAQHAAVVHRPHDVVERLLDMAETVGLSAVDLRSRDDDEPPAPPTSTPTSPKRSPSPEPDDERQVLEAFVRLARPAVDAGVPQVLITRPMIEVLLGLSRRAFYNT